MGKFHHCMADNDIQQAGRTYLLHDLVKELATSAQLHNQVELASIFKGIMKSERVGVLANAPQDGNLFDDVTAPVTLGRFARENLASILVTSCLHSHANTLAELLLERSSNELNRES